MCGIIPIVLGCSMILGIAAQPVTDEAAAHARAAQQAEARNDFNTAVREYSLAAKLLPRSAEIESNLGVALYFAGDKPRALEVFRKAIAANPELFVPHLFSGLAWFQLSQPGRSVGELEQAIRINASDPLARLWLGYAYSTESDYGAALTQFQEASRLQPDNADVWYALGQTYLKAGEKATNKLLSIAPDGGRAWQLAGEQYFLRGDRAKALTLFQGALERRPDLSQLRAVITHLGGTPDSQTAPAARHDSHDSEDRLYEEAQGSEQNAEAAFRKISELAPGSYRAHQVMGDAFAAQQRPQEAINEYQAALKLKPDLPGLHAAIGNNFLRIGKPQQALTEFRDELALQPFSSSACESVGLVLTLLGEDDEAERMLDRALRLDRPPLETYRLLGKIELRRRDYGDAIAMLTHYVSIKADDSTAWYLLAGAYRGTGNTAKMREAIELYKKTSADEKERARPQREIEDSAQKNQAAGTGN